MATTVTTQPIPQPLLTPAHAAAAGGGTGAASPEAVRRTAEEFEAAFLAQMLTGLFQGVGGEGGGLGLGGGPGSAGGGGVGEAFEGMLREEYAKLISRSGGIGLADEIRREMLKLQEVA
jgi:hypothetical protein